jgi:hypothetical protein
MTIRDWKPGFLLAVIMVSAGLALSLGAVAFESESWPLLLMTAALALIPSGVATAWSWNRTDVHTWHFGKILVLWGILVLSVWSFHSMDDDLAFVPTLLGGIPLLVLTWAWLGGRERST